jgi:hypothetical protein
MFLDSNLLDFGTFCSVNFTAIVTAFQSTATNKIAQYLQDLITAWQPEAICIAISVVLTLIFMVILRCCAKLLIWIVLFAFVALLALIAGFFWRQNTNATDSGDALNYKILSIIFWVLDGCVVIGILCLYDDINLALTVIEAAAQFVFQTFQILLVPFYMIALVCGFIIYWIATAAFIYSIGTFSPAYTTLYPTVISPIPQVTLNQNISNLLWYHVAGLFWVLCLLVGWVQFIVAATAAQWYFTSGSDASGSGSVCKSTYWTIRYHIGSIAIGSLILAIVMFIQFVFEYMKVIS